MRFPVDNSIPRDYNKPIIQAERSDPDDVQSFLQHGNEEYFCVRSQCERWLFLRTYRLHFSYCQYCYDRYYGRHYYGVHYYCGLIISLRAIAMIAIIIAILVLVVGLVIQKANVPWCCELAI